MRTRYRIAAAGVLSVLGAFVAYVLHAPAEQNDSVAGSASRDSAQQTRPPPVAKAHVAALKPSANPEPLRRIPARKMEPRRGRITFPDGEFVEVSFKPVKRPAIARPKALADAYEEFRRLAESGDASASWGLHRWLSQCNHAFADEASLERAVERLNREHVVTSPARADIKVESVANVQMTEVAMRQAFEWCRGITPQQRAEAPYWLELSVASGELFALQAEADEMRRSSPEHYLELMNKLWRDHGDVSALSSLAVLHRRGISGAGPDYRMVYAYQLAHFKLMESAYAGSVYPSHRNMLQAMEDSLATTASYLTPEQTAEAAALGIRLLADNKNCCTASQFGTVY